MSEMALLIRKTLYTVHTAAECLTVPGRITKILLPLSNNMYNSTQKITQRHLTVGRLAEQAMLV
jgi:hypothetical protein